MPVERRGVPNHGQFDCLLNGFYNVTTKADLLKKIKTQIAGPLWKESTGDQWVPQQRPVIRECVQLQFNIVKSIVVDALAPCVASTSAPMTMAMNNK